MHNRFVTNDEIIREGEEMKYEEGLHDGINCRMAMVMGMYILFQEIPNVAAKAIFKLDDAAKTLPQVSLHTGAIITQ